MGEIAEAVKSEVADTVKEMQDELVAQAQAEQAHPLAQSSTPAYSGPPWRRRRAHSSPQAGTDPSRLAREPVNIQVVVQPDDAQTNK
jgi:hypothetical protein